MSLKITTHTSQIQTTKETALPDKTAEHIDRLVHQEATPYAKNGSFSPSYIKEQNTTQIETSRQLFPNTPPRLPRKPSGSSLNYTDSRTPPFCDTIFDSSWTPSPYRNYSDSFDTAEKAFYQRDLSPGTPMSPPKYTETTKAVPTSTYGKTNTYIREKFSSHYTTKTQKEPFLDPSLTGSKDSRCCVIS